MKYFVWNLLVLLFLPVFFIASLLPWKKKRLLVWGSAPIISNKYWSHAMLQAGFESMTIMQGYYSINEKQDFDKYFEDFAPRFLPRVLRFGLGSCMALVYVLRNASVLHMSFLGFSLGNSVFWKLESLFLNLAGVRTIIIPYGADAYPYSRLSDSSLRYGLLASYPLLAKREFSIQSKIDHWSCKGDVVIPWVMMDGIGRWDVTVHQMFCIDCNLWKPKNTYSTADGKNGVVKVLHTPNHRGFKGTEFIINAVEQLQSEGLRVELLLMEKVPNSRVREKMAEADILAEQIIAPLYALSGVEGLATGLPVLANFENEFYTKVFRRYASLNECPIVSTSPENIKEILRVLIGNPELREKLGRAGRAFAEKYHSYETAHYIFGSIYDKILFKKDVDLINLFHPLKSAYNKSKPQVCHPLVNNRLPSEYFNA